MADAAPAAKRTRKRAAAAPEAPTGVAAAASAEPAPARRPKAATVPAWPTLRRTLEQGDRGPHIAAVQERLAALGHYAGRITGLYGYETVRAVRRLQGSRGLRPSGTIDAAAWAALYE